MNEAMIDTPRINPDKSSKLFTSIGLRLFPQFGLIEPDFNASWILSIYIITKVRYSIASTSCRMHGIVLLLFIIR
jgi:hypothetical protein